MGGDIYVAGPVVDGPHDRRSQLYAQFAAEAETAGLSVAVPERDGYLDSLPAGEFARAIAERIREASLVITVLSPDDQSVPVEAAMASTFGKRQLIVLDGAVAPRIMSGLPLVFDVVAADDPPTALAALGRFLRPGASRQL